LEPVDIRKLSIGTIWNLLDPKDIRKLSIGAIWNFLDPEVLGN